MYRHHNGTAYGLSSEPGEHWSRRAACRADPDVFFAPDTPGRWVPHGPLHTCWFHCPVREECAAYAQTQSLMDRARLILGGVAYDSRGQATRTTALLSCSLCRARRFRVAVDRAELAAAHG